MNGQKLEKVTSFEDMGATRCKNGTCSAEVRIRIASAMAAMARLNGSGGATPSASQASSSCTSLFSPPSSSMAVKHGPCLMTPIKGPCFRNQMPEGTSPHLLLRAQDRRLGAGQDQLLLWGHRNLFWQLSRDGNLRGSGMSHASTASPKP